MGASMIGRVHPLPTAHTAALAVCIGVLALIGTTLYRRFLHPLAHIPGPPLAKITGAWRDTHYWRGNWHEDVLALHRKYGPVVRIAPNELSVVDQQAMKLLYGHGHNTAKTEWYATWQPPLKAQNFFAARDKTLHAFLRKRVSGAYSMSSILKYEPFIQLCLDTLFSKFRKYADSDTVINMADWTNAFAFDVVGELSYGGPLGHLETETDVGGLRKNILNLFMLSTCMGHYWGQMTLFTNAVTQTTLRLLGQKDPLEAFRKWSISMVQPRYDALQKGRSGPDRHDMLEHFLNMKGIDGGRARFDEVLGEALNLIGAGADTTSIAIRACIRAIFLDRVVLEKLQQEIDSFYEANSTNEPITYLQCQKLPYLTAVCKEAMRLHPSIIWQLVRHAPETGLVVNGLKIPASATVGISPMAQNRDKQIWGDDAEDFRPERWLVSEERTRYLDSNDMTFGGSGPRMCIGRNIALVEVYKFVAQLVRNFDVEIVNPEQPWRVVSYWFAYQHDFFVRIKTRSH
ncbi:Cytochrome P450-like protein 23 [Elsinoe fawcettii]|nr:Cytochrome P450-like protein 23 [Elsinoe fawcettii]